MRAHSRRQDGSGPFAAPALLLFFISSVQPRAACGLPRGPAGGRFYLVRLFYKLYFWVHFRYKNGDCTENDYYAVSGPSVGPPIAAILTSCAIIQAIQC
jgi:hypothetical protein